ncbi:MAG: hypothetical protein WKF75_15990 [Singulisphaera sp.]
MPENAALRGRRAVPTVVASVRADAETSVEVRAQPVGYVRGTIRLPEGRDPADYVIQPGIDWRSRMTQYRVDREAGRFLCGPLLPGKLVIHYQVGGGEHLPTGRHAGGGGAARRGRRHRPDPGAADPGPASKDQGQVVLGMGA